MRQFTMAVAGLLSWASMSSAGVLVDFETTPDGGTPVDNTVLSTPYVDGGISVQFFFDVNGNNTYDVGIDALPVFEKAGASDPTQGFVANGGNDTAAPGFGGQLGQFFLRQPPTNQFGVNVPGPFIIDYTTALNITALSGEIWDIDGLGINNPGTEQWRVEVLDGTGGILASQLSPLGVLPSNGAPLDGKPWVFGFSNLPTGVDKVRLTFIGGKTSGIGLAFNNFQPTTSALQPVPEPSTFVLGGLGLLGGLGYHIKRRRRLSA